MDIQNYKYCNSEISFITKDNFVAIEMIGVSKIFWNNDYNQLKQWIESYIDTSVKLNYLIKDLIFFDYPEKQALYIRADIALKYSLRFNSKDFVFWLKNTLIDINPNLREQLNLIIPEYKKITPSTQNKQISIKDCLTDKQKIDYFDTFINRGPLISLRTTAKQLGLRQKDFINFLFQNNFVYYNKKGKILPYIEFNNKFFKIKEYQTETHCGVQTLVTPLGREHFNFLFSTQQFDKSFNLYS